MNKLIQLAERLKNEIPRAQYQQLQQTIERRQERLQGLMKSCQQARGEHEHLVKTQNKLNEELISINDWLKRHLYDLNQPLELNLSLNNVHDAQDSVAVRWFLLLLRISSLFVATRCIDRSTFCKIRSSTS